MYAVHDTTTGRLVSLGTVLANPLPAGLTPVAVAQEDTDALAVGGAVWDPTTRTFTHRDPAVLDGADQTLLTILGA